MENTWVDIASKFGLPVALLVGVLYGVYQLLIKRVWPFVERQIEEAQAHSKLQTDRFVESLRARDNLMAEGHRENIKALEAMTNELRAMTNEVRGLRDEVRNNHK